MAILATNKICTISIDDVEWLYDLSSGALIKHPFGTLDISASDPKYGRDAKTSISINISADTFDNIEREFSLIVKEMKEAGEEAIAMLKQEHPDWVYPTL